MSSELEPNRDLPVLAGEIRSEVEQADRDWQSAVGHAIRAGELLTEAKAQVKHGEWLPWLEANFPGSETTARNYMRLAANRQRVADLPTVREAVAVLAEPRQLQPGQDPGDRVEPQKIGPTYSLETDKGRQIAEKTTSRLEGAIGRLEGIANAFDEDALRIDLALALADDERAEEWIATLIASARSIRNYAKHIDNWKAEIALEKEDQ